MSQRSDPTADVSTHPAESNNKHQLPVSCVQPVAGIVVHDASGSTAIKGHTDSPSRSRDLSRGGRGETLEQTRASKDHDTPVPPNIFGQFSRFKTNQNQTIVVPE